MAQRYELQIGEQSPAGGFIQAPAVNASQIGAGIASIGGALGQWAAFKQKQQDEWDAATVMNAQTEFQKQMNDWLYNPETGQSITRKLGNAKNITDDTDNYSDKLIQDISSRLENDKQRMAFRNTAARLKEPYWEQMSRYEARELKQHGDNAFKSGIQAAVDSALNNPDSDSARNGALVQIEQLVRSHYYGADEVTLQQTILDLQSGLDTNLIAKIARDDPVGAMAILNNKDNDLRLTPEARDRLIASIKPKAEVYEIQAITDDIANQFGFENWQGTINYIRRNYSGDKENKLISAYKTRLDEYNAVKRQEEIARNKAQEDYYGGLVTNYLQTGQWPSMDKINQDVANGQLSPHRAKQIKDSQKAAITRQQIKAKLSKEAGWGDLSREEQETRIMNEMAQWSGVTQEDRERVLGYLSERVVTNTITNNEIKYALDNGLITEGEAEEFRKYNTRLKAAQQEINKNEARLLRQNIAGIERAFADVWSDRGIEYYQGKAAEIFHAETKNLDPKDPNYHKKVIEARRKALLTAMENSNLELSENKWQGWFTWQEERTEFGKHYDTRASSLRDYADSKGNKPLVEIRRDNITINSGSSAEKTGKSAGKGNFNQAASDTPLWHSVTAVRGISSHYGKRGDRHHKGIDILTPNGSAVKVPPLSGLKVQGVTDGLNKNDPKDGTGYGNNIVLGGKLSNGDTIQVRMAHLQKGSITVKKGDTVSPGKIIAKTGNTGRTYGKNGGYHLHFEVLINGKPVDPERYLLSQAKKQKSDREAVKKEADTRLSQITLS